MDTTTTKPGYAIRMAGRSDIGRVRDNNEDYLDWDVTRGLALLADGVGGGNAGEVASRMAVATLLEMLPDHFDVTPAAECLQQLRDAISQANRRIYENGRHAPFQGMSTTLVTLWLCGKQAIFGHVGDSRIYQLRNGKLTQLTVDHSLVQEMIDKGVMTQEQADTSDNRHLITRALGIAAQVEADLLVTSVRAGDRYLLCSDGLSDMLDDEKLTTLLQQDGQPLAGQVDILIEHANQRGGDDNISALIVAIDDKQEIISE